VSMPCHYVHQLQEPHSKSHLRTASSYPRTDTNIAHAKTVTNSRIAQQSPSSAPTTNAKHRISASHNICLSYPLPNKHLLTTLAHQSYPWYHSHATLDFPSIPFSLASNPHSSQLSNSPGHLNNLAGRDNRMHQSSNNLPFRAGHMSTSAVRLECSILSVKSIPPIIST